MKKIYVNGFGEKEFNVRKYEPTLEFEKYNTIPADELDLDELWTDEESIFAFDEASNQYVRIWDYV